MIDPPLLRDRARWERVMDGWSDSAGDDAFAHTVRLIDPDRAVEVGVLALPPPAYEIREASCRVLAGAVDPAVAAGVERLAGVAMVPGFGRRVAEETGRRPGAPLVLDALIEVARLARQVNRWPRAEAERAARGGPAECWRLDMTAWNDLPDSCFTYSDAGRALFGTRPVTTTMRPDLYSPEPGQRGVFRRRKVARLERLDGRLRLSHSMHDDLHGFEVAYEVDPATGAVVKAECVTSRLPYTGICSEPQPLVQRLVGEVVDAGLRQRLGALIGGTAGCAQLYALTADLLRLLGST